MHQCNCKLIQTAEFLLLVMCMNLKSMHPNFVIVSWAHRAGSEKVTHLVWQYNWYENPNWLMNIEPLDNIHLSDYFHGSSSTSFTLITYTFSFFNVPLLKQPNIDTNLNKPQSKRKVHVYSCPGQQRAWSRGYSGSTQGLITDKWH